MERQLTRNLYLTIEDEIMHFHRVYEKYDFSISFERIEKIYRRWASDGIIKEQLCSLTGATVAGLLLDWFGNRFLDAYDMGAALQFVKEWASGLTIA